MREVFFATVIAVILWVHAGPALSWMGDVMSFSDNRHGREVCDTKAYYVPLIFIPCFLSEKRAK